MEARALGSGVTTRKSSGASYFFRLPCPVLTPFSGSLQVFFKLLILHQQIGLIHGDAKPSATVITTSPSGSDLVRWVDFGAATEHAEACGGLACRELRQCLMSMRLSGEMLDKLREEVEAAGLVL